MADDIGPDPTGDRPWWVDPWIDAVGRPAEMVPLDRAATLLAAHGLRGSWDALGPAVVDRTITALDELARSCPEPTFEGVHQLLFGVMGFRGDREQYHAPRNSFLPIVLARRRGIPISLAVVLIEVARRVRVDIVGIGMPGHFLTAFDGPEGTRWIDVFDGGTILDLDGVSKVHASMFAGAQPFDPAIALPEVDAHAMLVRMLANLKSTASFARDIPALADLVWLRQALPGPTVQERREHIRLSLAVGRFATAAEGIDALAAAVGDDDVMVVEERQRFAALLS